MPNPDIYEILLKASEIPEGATVCKPTGEKEYKLLSKYPYNNVGFYPVYLTDCKFMISTKEEGTINVVSNSTLLKWRATADEAYNFFSELVEPTPQ